jgi:(1->4)-alpha-D-glucan 1-alpha-D-glucosylmutase
MAARIPVATYRLQFNAQFTFRDAQAIVDYLHCLGITDCYASSYLKTVPGSLHGYDVADPTRLNPEVGTREEYDAWVGALRSHAMGQLLDVVPNHMGIAKSANPWWLDILENGPSSRFASFFDIDWHPVKAELADKLLIPILSDQYGSVLERQELKVVYQDGAFIVRYFDDVIPIAPDTYGAILEPELSEPTGLEPPLDAADVDELRSIVIAGRNLPSRSTRDADLVAVRAREKEIVKRRLASLVDRSAGVGALVDRAVTRINGVAGQPRSFDLLDNLLNRQSYRLAHWRVASEEINYRRFFDINQLAALRMEDPAVFDEVHRFVFELVRQGAATGLRIDHVDGLYAPSDYLHRVQARASEELGENGDPSTLPIFLVVEKILGADERLPGDWLVHGTTGYEFAAVVNRLFVDGRNERAMDEIYRRFVHDRAPFAEIGYRSKKQVMHETMSGDINSLGHQLNRFSESNRHFRDFTLYSLISTIKEIIACFPVYRTYVTPDEPVSSHDRRFITEAVRVARRRAAITTPVVFDFVESVLLKQIPSAQAEDHAAQASFIGKFQQITGPIAAKGIEDTACYVYNRLISLNEVGGDPTQFGMTPGEVHAWLASRQRRWPAALSATSTHDTKRGEDVRARIDVLSEIPGAWKSAVVRWRAVNRRQKTDVRGAPAPDANEEYFLYQTLVGVWPFESAGDSDALRDRLRTFVVKALREAKVHTTWLAPDEEYEAGVLRFLDAILDTRRQNPFLASFLPFQARVAELGIYNSLAQLVIKIAAPGVPDFYQGTELWDLNLVDPDNRRPVDYGRRRQALASLNQDLRPEQLLECRTTGLVKLFVMRRALEVRARMRELFEHGEYVPLDVSGARRECLFAFARRTAGDEVIACVPRMVASLVPEAAGPPIGAGVWTDTRVEVGGGPRSLRNAFTGETIEAADGTIAAAQLFERFPVALLTCSTSPS